MGLLYAHPDSTVCVCVCVCVSVCVCERERERERETSDQGIMSRVRILLQLLLHMSETGAERLIDYSEP